MVTENGIWTSNEGGRSWVKMKSSPADLLRIWFLDHDHGYAVGRSKRVYETKDGGATWKLLEIAATVSGDPLIRPLVTSTLVARMGMIAGWNIPPRRGGPDWMEASPRAAAVQVPPLTVLLETKTGGASWVKSEASLFGQITEGSACHRGALGLVSWNSGISSIIRVKSTVST